RVPIFVNGSFLEFEVADSFKLFPTLEDPRDNAALIVNADRLVATLNANPRGPVSYPDETWLKASAAASPLARDAINTGRISGNLFSFEELRDAQQKDPLVAAGWEGILFISFAAILILSAIGFLIYSYLTAQRRTLEFAVLRTMGFSKRQIALVVGFEQVFVIGLGMIAGTLMGMRLGSLMIRYMGLTETGDEVLPPMHLQINWLTVGTAWLVLGIVFLVTIAAVVLLYSRLALHRVLRIGET
ncbi:MAG TPA: ABC transporter permease, partial [Dehalococcoidia bacterium]|nr:ABC transporter permease [Dehalococcoidia bacterium]